MTTGLQVQERNFFRRLDINFTTVILVLNIVGLINLYSATHGLVESPNERLFWQQIFWLGAGWIAFFLCTLIHYQMWKRIAHVLYFVNLGLIVVVSFVGTTIYGSKRWLDLGFFNYQPTETMKLCIILLLASVLSKRKTDQPMGLLELLKPTLLTGLAFVLTVKQPDLGTGLLIAAISGSMILFVGVNRAILVVTFLIGLITAPLVWNFALKDYQRDRVLTFIAPGKDPRGAGYNSIQSRIAVGSGKVLGKGFRRGTQSQLEFIPERHSDFIFSVLSEEHGFIGSSLTVGLYVVLLLMGVIIASHAKDRFGALVAVGVTAMLFWHMFINISMVIGILPIVGVPLPLLSYGGSSSISTMVGLGLISAISYRRYLF